MVIKKKQFVLTEFYSSSDVLETVMLGNWAKYSRKESFATIVGCPAGRQVLILNRLFSSPTKKKYIFF